MDFRRLEVFCKVIELGSFTKASNAVFLSQPTVSEHIRLLEELVGEKLVDRLGREALPTAAGTILYRYAQKMIRLREEALDTLALHRERLLGDLLIGASTIPGTYILPSFIGGFKTMHPDIRITLSISNTSQIAQATLNGDMEYGLVGSHWKDSRLAFETIFSDELILVVFPGHPWAEQRTIRLDMLQNEPFILRQRGSGTRMVMNTILEQHGFDFSQIRVVAEMGSTEAVRQSVKAGIGISILSRRAVADDIKWGALFPVDVKDVRFNRPFYLVRRKNRNLSPVGAAFLNHLKA